MIDRDLFAYVNSVINSGAKEISIPGYLIAGASKEAIEEACRLCKLCGVVVREVTM